MKHHMKSDIITANIGLIALFVFVVLFFVEHIFSIDSVIITIAEGIALLSAIAAYIIYIIKMGSSDS